MSASRCHLRRCFLGFACLIYLTHGFKMAISFPTLSTPCLKQTSCDSIEEVKQFPTTDYLKKEDGAIDDNNNNSIGQRKHFEPWNTARKSLRDPRCCVVSVCSPRSHTEKMGGERSPLDAHLAVLQEGLADRGPSDIDIRARIDTSTIASATSDCIGLCSSIFGDGSSNDDLVIPSATALAEFAMGMASFADDCGLVDTRHNTTNGVFLRIVCASSYRAHDPVFHTDKCTLRGYATLRGVGTEFATAPCSSPLDYLSLRTLGKPLPRLGLGGGVGDEGPLVIERAAESEFIVMKGDYYYSNPRTGNTAAAAAAADGGTSVSSWWQRAFACVHRSPPGTSRGGRRVILSFDLADGDDDREWHDVHKRRQWRAGMTQRKSKLVA